MCSTDVMILTIPTGGVPVLGPESSSGYFLISSTISLPASSQYSPLYLNVNTTGSQSYKTLTLDPVATTTDWALEGDTIIESDPRELNFLACETSDPSFYELYMQLGNDMPTGESCSLVSLHLDCLC